MFPGGPLAPYDGDLLKRCLQTFCQLDRIVVGPKVDKKRRGLGATPSSATLIDLPSTWT
jgi:hypothetical protein